MDSLFRKLIDLDLPKGHFAVFGSGPLVIRDIIPAANDIDVLCRGAAWTHAQTIGDVEYLNECDIEIVSADNGQLTFGTRWAIGSFDTNELIDTAEMLEGLPFVQLEHVIAYKRVADRAKDREHLSAMRLNGYLD